LLVRGIGRCGSPEAVDFLMSIGEFGSGFYPVLHRRGPSAALYLHSGLSVTGRNDFFLEGRADSAAHGVVDGNCRLFPNRAPDFGGLANYCHWRLSGGVVRLTWSMLVLTGRHWGLLLVDLISGYCGMILIWLN